MAFSSKEWCIDLLKKVLQAYGPTREMFGAQAVWSNTNYKSDSSHTAAGNTWTINTTDMTAMFPTVALRSNNVASSILDFTKYKTLTIYHTLNGTSKITTIDVSNIKQTGYIVFSIQLDSSANPTVGIYISSQLEYYVTYALTAESLGSASSWSVTLVQMQ